ncbi:MAG: hypothetical protein R3326_09060 [Gemmatimonadota bacterium]|nr:hypothetical protein [Gemmatimonadota bacterium]
MRKTLLTGVLALLVFGLLGADLAQAQEDEGPGNRYVTVTTFDVPFNDRGPVFDFIQKRFWPAWQLNPNIINARFMLHNWGANASQVVLVAEYPSWDAIEAGCGAPCDEYYEANPAPEEGEEGYEEFSEAQRLFNKYYAHHADEIYTTPMAPAKVEGELMGPVGGDDDEE